MRQTRESKIQSDEQRVSQRGSQVVQSVVFVVLDDAVGVTHAEVHFCVLAPANRNVLPDEFSECVDPRHANDASHVPVQPSITHVVDIDGAE